MIEVKKIDERDGFVLAKIFPKDPSKRIFDHDINRHIIKSAFFQNFPDHSLIDFRELILILDVLQFLFKVPISGVLCDNHRLTNVPSTMGILLTNHPENVAPIYTIHFSRGNEAEAFFEENDYYVLLLKKEPKKIIDKNFGEFLTDKADALMG